MFKEGRLKFIAILVALVIGLVFCSKDVLGQNTENVQAIEKEIKMSDTLFKGTFPLQGFIHIISEDTLLERLIKKEGHILYANGDTASKTVNIVILKKGSKSAEYCAGRLNDYKKTSKEFKELKETYKQSNKDLTEYATKDYDSLQIWLKEELEKGRKITFVTYDKETGVYGASSVGSVK